MSTRSFHCHIMCWFMKMFRCYWLMSCWSRKFGCENDALHHAHTTKLSWYPLGNSTGQRHEEAFKVTNSSKAYPFLTPDPHLKYLYSRLLELGNSVTSAPTRLSQVYSSYLHYRQLNLTHKTQWTNQHLHSLTTANSSLLFIFSWTSILTFSFIFFFFSFCRPH